MVLPPSKKFIRAAKGTMIRGSATQALDQEIDNLYIDSQDLGSNTTTIPLLDTAILLLPSIEQFVRDSVDAAWNGIQLEDHDDFFSKGVYYLQTSRLTANLRASLKNQMAVSSMTPRTIYENPTIKQLSKVIVHMLTNRTLIEAKLLPGPVNHDNRLRQMQNAVHRLTTNYARCTKITEPRDQRALIVAIVGTTGFLGSQLLLELIQNPTVIRVYCLNRASNAESEFQQASQGHSTRVRFYRVDFGAPSLGLSADIFQSLVKDIDVIIHNTWQVRYKIRFWCNTSDASLNRSTSITY